MDLLKFFKVCKDFKIKSLGEYHNLHAQSDMVCNNFQKYVS